MLVDLENDGGQSLATQIRAAIDNNRNDYTKRGAKIKRIGSRPNGA